MISALLSCVAHSISAQIAVNKCKFLGNVIGNSVPTSFDLYWNQVTPENAGKWGEAEAEPDVMNWAPLDAAYDHAMNR